ncbi:hypothetical protein [Nocardia pseudobrasiliensis]|nr:hypothetical protein [Nocardia pseudobrasiliensis]
MTRLSKAVLPVAAAAALLCAPLPTATANVGGIAVMYTGSEGPVLGCPHEVGFGLSDPVLPDTHIYIDGVETGPLNPYPYSGYWVRWTPDRLGWRTPSRSSIPHRAGRNRAIASTSRCTGSA